MEHGSGEQKPAWKHVDFCSNTLSISQRQPTLFIFDSWRPVVLQDAELQTQKEKIGEYESAHIWELAKKMANPYECIYTQDDSHFHPSLCVYKPLSRSFYKMIEILKVSGFFEGLPKTLNKVRSAHVCEGPGGFIQAFLEMAEKNKKLVTSATAITLKPTDNHTPGWRRATSFLQRHREVVLHYGADETGDIYKKGNQDSFVAAVKPGVHLFTADGGFDFSQDYNEQEKSIFHLLISSAQIGLRSLLPGGLFVLKCFDIYTQPTQILLSILGTAFSSWCLYKPTTSRPCNSERYFIGCGFRGTPSADFFALLTTMEEQSSKGRFPYADTYFTATEEAYFKKNIEGIQYLQKGALHRAESYIQNPSAWSADFQHHFQLSQKWCMEFQMPYIQKAPIGAAVTSVVSQMSVKVAHLQSRRPGAVTNFHHPSDPA